MLASPMMSKMFRLDDVARLGALGATAEQRNHGCPLANKVSPVPGPRMQAQFEQAAAQRVDVIGHALRKAQQP